MILSEVLRGEYTNLNLTKVFPLVRNLLFSIFHVCCGQLTMMSNMVSIKNMPLLYVKV